jgi:hypothetical protein
MVKVDAHHHIALTTWLSPPGSIIVVGQWETFISCYWRSRRALVTALSDAPSNFVLFYCKSACKKYCTEALNDCCRWACSNKSFLQCTTVKWPTKLIHCLFFFRPHPWTWKCRLYKWEKLLKSIRSSVNEKLFFQIKEKVLRAPLNLL